MQRRLIDRYLDKREESPDVIIFGHSHGSLLENHEDILRINPGNPTFPYYKQELDPVGLLTVNSGKAEAQIIQLQDRPDIK